MLIPDKKYFTIGEISQLTSIKPHVLRYWEQVVPMLQPTKRSGRRYYQRQDVLIILEIDRLLHNDGYTLAGALMQIKAQGLPDVNGIASVKAVVRPKKSIIALEKLESHLKGVLRKAQRYNLSTISRWDNLGA